MPRSIISRLGRYIYVASNYVRFAISSKTLSYPRMIQIQTQSQCNARCAFCPYSTTSKKFQSGVMDLGLFKKIIDEIKAVSYTKNVLFELHNEPLLDHRVFELIKYIKQKNNHCQCSVVTNGQNLDDFSVQEIVDSKLDNLTISLNAFNRKTYEEWCGLDYQRTINNISKISENNLLKHKLTLSFVVTKQLAPEIRQSLKYWRERGIKTRTLEVMNRAGTLSNYGTLKPRKNLIHVPFTTKIGRFFIDKIIQQIGCYEVFNKINILYNGDVIICCHDWERTTVLGNLKESSIREIWNSAKTNSLRRHILHKQYSQIECCKNCSLAK
jgi:radical SAM protein with 4Fe4S-binding SPASM domain